MIVRNRNEKEVSPEGRSFQEVLKCYKITQINKFFTNVILIPYIQNSSGLETNINCDSHVMWMHASPVVKY